MEPNYGSPCAPGQVVTNDFPQITHDLYFEWRDYRRPDAPNLWPEECHVDWLEDRLDDRGYLMGNWITEADVRLFTTLARFDPVYHGHFKCNRNKLIEMPNLWGYARDLFQTPAFG